jgi:UDP-GlcNAc:undecaprenyl-phosphate GlcNAc-1-phosphate transferase
VSVLVLYAWTAVVSVGVLLFLFLDTWWAALGTLLGLAACTIITFAPLSRPRTDVIESADPDDPDDFAELHTEKETHA